MSGPVSTLIPLQASPRLLSWLAAMAEALTLPLLLVREDGTLVQANMSGLGELKRARWVRSDGDRVVAAQAERAASLVQALQVSARGRSRVEWPPVAVEAGAAGDSDVAVIAPVGRDRGATLLMMVLPAEAPMDEACRLFAYQYGLSQAELDVLYAVCQGHTPQQIARRRGVSVSTVRAQLSRVKHKCGEDSMGTLLPRVKALPPVGTPR